MKRIMLAVLIVCCAASAFAQATPRSAPPKRLTPQQKKEKLKTANAKQAEQLRDSKKQAAIDKLKKGSSLSSERVLEAVAQAWAESKSMPSKPNKNRGDKGAASAPLIRSVN